MNAIEACNRTLFLLINAGDGTPAWLIQVAIGIAEGSMYLIPLFLLGLWLRGNSTQRSQVLKACLVTLLALGANHVIRLAWPHPRPFMMGLGQVWLHHAAVPSFPSNHMTVFTSIGLTLLFGGKFRLAAAMLALGLAVAWARVFLGVHFPLDMMGAVLVSVVAYASISPFWRMTGDRLSNRAERLYRTFLARPIASGWLRR
jgi:undecaprenyl-diphosphatase